MRLFSIEDLVAVVIICIVGAVFIAPAYILSSMSCSKYGEYTDRHTEFSVLGGCYVKHGDRMIPRDEYKYIEIKQPAN